MLQIVSGRFFGDGKINEAEHDAVLYSNLSWIGPFDALVGEVRPADSRGTRISSYVLRYKVRYEPTPGDIMVLPHGDLVAEHLRLVAGLWFKAFFHPDRDYVERLCRTDPARSSDSAVHSQYIDRFFDAPAETEFNVVEAFRDFVAQVVGMPRKAFRLFMTCLAAYFDAMESVIINPDLAYSMFAYVLEGLTQQSDNFVPTWLDVPQDDRDKIDAVLAHVPEEHAAILRDVLVEDKHLKLMKRFLEFTTSHIQDSFFTVEAAGRQALRKNELSRTLSNLYQSRSGYVHTLRQIQEHLRQPGWTRHADVFRWQNDPHLTFSGLARICRHVLLSFVDRQPKADKEDYPRWRSELPGIIQVEFDHTMWVARTDSLNLESLKSRFGAFVKLALSRITNPAGKLPDIRPVMAQIEEMLPQSPADKKNILACLYYLGDEILGEKYRRPNYEQIVKRHAGAIEACSIYTMVISSLTSEADYRWPAAICEESWKAYLKGKFKSEALNLPAIVEAAVLTQIANLHFAAGNLEGSSEWIHKAILDAAGDRRLQGYLEQCREKQERVCQRELLGVPKVTSE